MDFIRLVDNHNTGEISPLGLKIMITFLSDMPTKEKWFKIVDLYPYSISKEEIEVKNSWDFIYFWSSILLRDFSEILSNKHLITSKLDTFSGGMKFISSEQLIFKILEMPETSFFAYFIKVSLKLK